jgi:hypothetical protein
MPGEKRVRGHIVSPYDIVPANACQSAIFQKSEKTDSKQAFSPVKTTRGRKSFVEKVFAHARGFSPCILRPRHIIEEKR